MAARLYQFLGSPYCAKIRKILDFKAIDYEIVEVDYLERRELLAASGQIMVPALTLDSGETIADSARIAERLEELYPEPTLLPPGWRGMHRAMSDYLDNTLEDALFRAAIPDELVYYRGQLIRERKYGAGFVDRMITEHEAQMAHAHKALERFEEALGERAFLFGRIGLADFCLYGQLFYIGFTGELKLPLALGNLRAYYGRMDRISSKLDQA
jgi:glutathione S-transferase